MFQRQSYGLGSNGIERRQVHLYLRLPLCDGSPHVQICKEGVAVQRADWHIKEDVKDRSVHGDELPSCVRGQFT
jgi:hypothetical protein